MRDRGFILLFGGVSALLYVVFAFTPMSYATLIVAVVLLTASFAIRCGRPERADFGDGPATRDERPDQRGMECLPVDSHRRSLADRRQAQRDAGRQGPRFRRSVSCFWSGPPSRRRLRFYGLWKPAAVFDNIRVENGTGRDPMGDIKRLLRHWPIYPAMLIWLLWNFAPGSTTPLQYHLQNTPACHRRPMGAVECHLRRLLHSDLHRVRISLPQVSPEDAVVVGNGRSPFRRWFRCSSSIPCRRH